MSAKRKRSSKPASGVWGLISWAVATLVSSAGVAGWALPTLPFVGPAVSGSVAQLQKGWTGWLQTPAAAPGGGAVLPGLPLPGLSPPGAAPGGTVAPGLPPAGTAYTTAARPAGPTIHIASFNIQVFGESKLSEAWVVDVLARVVRQFEVVAIQEVRAKSDTVLPQFTQAINADGSQYQFVLGPRLGRTSSKEQYAILYDTRRIEVDPNSVATVQDPEDRLHREPLIARFRVRCNPPEAGFTFWLADVHTDPDEVPQEIETLSYVFEAIQRANPAEDDVILLGDLNASEKQLGRLGQLPGIRWAVANTTTNTRRTRCYDNLIFQGQATAEFTGRWGVLDLMQTFGLTTEQALKVSDHMPVWGEFTAAEAVPAVAGLPGQVR